MPLRALLTWSLPQQKATREGAELMLYKQNTPRNPCLEILGLSYQVTSLGSYQFSGCTLQFFLLLESSYICGYGRTVAMAMQFE